MPPADTMLARVARAMQESKAWPAVFGDGAAKELARAALKAMRDIPNSLAVPGGLAIEEAMFNDGKLVFDAARDCVNAVITAALAEHKEGGK